MSRAKLAVVTGASSGFGAASARALRRAGFELVLGARREDRLRAVAEPLGARWQRLDVTDPAAVEDVKAKGHETCADLWTMIEVGLSRGGWAAGERYSVADPYLLVFWHWGRGQVLGYDMARQFPHWTDHARRMAERPAVQRAFAREGLALPA